jgi:uncharacterized protein YcnI
MFFAGLVVYYAVKSQGWKRRKEIKRALMHTSNWQQNILIVWGVSGILIVAATAWGHSDLDPRQSIPSKWETYTLNVPTETEVPTVQVRLLVPRDFEIEMIEHSPLWQITRSRDERGYIREVTWSGSSIPPQTFAEFKLLVRNPAAPGTSLWKIEQYYQDGNVATWEAQTQIVPQASMGGTQRAEEAWRAAQVATTVSLVAIGISVTLIIVTTIGIMQRSRSQKSDELS